MRYFIGGYTWNKQSQFDRFVDNGIWENGYEEDKYSELFSEISIGDYFALKSTYVRGRKPDAKSYLRISQIGIVTEILSKSSIKIDWITNEEFDLTDIKWYANTLEEISFEGDINRIFSQTKYMSKMKENIDLLNYKKQIILQGPPGTGKTREAKLLAEAISSKNVPENISHKHIGDIIYEGLTLKTKENYSFQIKEVDILIKRIIIIPQSAPVNEYPVTFDQILKCYESKGWNDKISQWNQNGNASYLVSISKHIYDFLLEKNKDTVKTVQFHPSYTYEDFVRGIVAKPNDDGEGITYEAENKTLGKFAEDAIKNLEGLQKSSLNIYDEEVFEQFRLSIILKIAEDEKFELTNNIYISEVDEKKFKYKGDNWKRHPKGLNIRFSELKKVIESNPEIRKNIVKNTSLKSLTKSHATYFFELYTKYKEFYEAHKNDLIINEGEKKYVLIIDEINRANLSSVLGELIYALEYRDEEVESMYEVDGSQKLVLPKNLLIIGTMNTADRSVGHIDYAIRRRFAFVDVLPKDLTAEMKDGEFYTDLFLAVKALFTTDDYITKSDFISHEFEPKDVALGHSYFIDKTAEGGDNKTRWNYEIKPILLEYIRDGVLKNNAAEQIEKIESDFNLKI
ncbi:hypothetical protein GCM10022217_41260 [Chryseobacterium ginsenosidimutans]|uniref:AAA family ATPase n=1 Tax=Chryseobacterium ginsenosidimutans TaxID=687846 RepID=UPI0031DF3326